MQEAIIPAETLKQLSATITALQSMMPKHTSGLPLAYIDPERVLATGMLDQISESPPEDAVIPISYSEGFPTVDGLPFWERLDGEPFSHYELFKRYRNLGPQRSLYKVSQISKTPLPEISGLARTWHWQARAAAYDLYERQQLELAREQQIKIVENKHYKIAEEITDLCLSYLKENTHALTPRAAATLLELAARLQRLSLGLHPERPSNTPDQPNTNIQNITNITNIQNNAIQDPASINEQRRTRVVEILSILQTAGVLTNLAAEPAPATKAAPVATHGATHGAAHGAREVAIDACEPSTTAADAATDVVADAAADSD